MRDATDNRHGAIGFEIEGDWPLGATCTVLTMDSLSPKNIMIDFLALAFLHEADSIVARIFLSEEQQILINRQGLVSRIYFYNSVFESIYLLPTFV